jgi:hypothetical protein
MTKYKKNSALNEKNSQNLEYIPHQLTDGFFRSSPFGFNVM